jgi:putative ABC transport system permease protein
MVALSLAVGIGANTAIFSMVNGILLRPLNYPEPERLVAITQASPQFLKLYPTLPVNLGAWMEWRKHVTAFESVGVYRATALNLTGVGEPEVIRGAAISANFLHVLGVAPRLGRAFLEEEDQKGRDHVVVLADSLWRRRFQADPGIVGRNITLDGNPYLVTGVLPPDFDFPKAGEVGPRLTEKSEIYRPLGYEPDDLTIHGGDLNYWPVARLRPGVSIERASAELNAAQTAINAKIGPDFDMRATIMPLQARLVGNVRQNLIVLLCAVGAVLMVLCVNLVNLSLARAAGRARDAAIRTALGASRADLIGQSAAESVALSALGGGLGVLLAYWGLHALIAAAPIDLPRVGDVRLDARVLAFAAAISIITGLLFGILPAWLSARRLNPFEELKAGSRGSTEGRSGIRARNVLVSLEVGLSAALLVTAGLLTSSFIRLTGVNKGFDISRVITLNISMPTAKYVEDVDRTQFWDRLMEKVRTLPGVESTAMISALPLQGETWIDIVQTENDTRPERELPSTNLRFVSEGYFKTLRIPLREGRDFDRRDRGHNVIVISAGLAQKLWPGQDAVGRRLKDHGTVMEVVGITPDIRSTSLDRDPVNIAYVPYWQRPRWGGALMVRTAMAPEGMAGALRGAIWGVDAEVPVPKIRTMEDVLNISVAQRRFQMMLVLLFAGAALALAALGTYGVVSYAVTRRRTEMGIRMALGAGRAEVLAMVLRQGMMPVCAGLGGGAIAAVWIGQAVAGLLFETGPRDPGAFSIAAAALLVISAMACWIPARRATRVDPMEALRLE